MLTKQKLPRQDLDRILSSYDLGSINQIKPLVTSGNIAYMVETGKGKFFLRLCPTGPRYRSKGEVAAELELIDHLLQNKFPAPVPVVNKDGEIITSWKGHYGYLRYYIEAEAILEPTITEVEEFGKVLGWLHRLVEGFKTKNKRTHIFDLSQTLKHFRLNKNRILKSNFKNSDQFVAKVEKELSQLEFPLDLPLGMIHEDLGKRHALWKKSKIICLVDFDRSYYGQLVLDVGQSVRGWCFVKDWSKWSNNNFQALISGYQSKRLLTDLEKKCLPEAIKFGVIERGIAFCLRYIEVTQDPEDEDFAYKSAFDFLKMLENNRKEINRILDI